MTNLEKKWDSDIRNILDGMISSANIEYFEEEIQIIKESLVNNYVTKAKESHLQMEKEMAILRKDIKRRETVYDYD